MMRIARMCGMKNSPRKPVLNLIREFSPRATDSEITLTSIVETIAKPKVNP
jgi:hypothetical protein